MRIPEEIIIQNLIAYKNGEKRIVDIANELDINYTTVDMWIKKAGIRKKQQDIIDWARIKKAVNKVEL